MLLSGEYVVLSGAKGLAVPTRAGQTLEISESGQAGQLLWQSFLLDGSSWFQGRFSVSDWEVLESSDLHIAKRLQELFVAICSQNPAFAEKANKKQATTRLEFPAEWGFGSSSTLIYMLSKWANVDPFFLLDQSFGGSGYDLIAAGASGPFMFWRDPQPQFAPIRLDWPFREALFLVYLGKKQNSREGIQRYRQRETLLQKEIQQVSALSEQLVEVKTRENFEGLLQEHELLLSQLLDLTRVQDLHFSDFPGVVKSLGAWGGDFVLVSSGGLSAKAVKDYFHSAGFKTIFPFSEIVLC